MLHETNCGIYSALSDLEIICHGENTIYIGPEITEGDYMYFGHGIRMPEGTLLIDGEGSLSVLLTVPSTYILSYGIYTKNLIVSEVTLNVAGDSYLPNRGISVNSLTIRSDAFVNVYARQYAVNGDITVDGSSLQAVGGDYVNNQNIGSALNRAPQLLNGSRVCHAALHYDDRSDAAYDPDNIYSYQQIAIVNTCEMYRLYNPNAGEHHYTLSYEERNYLVSLGWQYEGIGWYSQPRSYYMRSLYTSITSQYSIPLYRQYNPNAFANNHNYTTSLEENDWLVSLGWQAERVLAGTELDDCRLTLSSEYGSP